MDVPENLDVLGASLQRKRNGQRIRIAARKQTIFKNEVKRRVLLQKSLFAVDNYFHFYYFCKMIRKLTIIFASLTLLIASIVFIDYWNFEFPYLLIFLITSSIVLHILSRYVKGKSARRTLATLSYISLATWILLLLFLFVAFYVMAIGEAHH